MAGFEPTAPCTPSDWVRKLQAYFLRVRLSGNAPHCQWLPGMGDPGDLWIRRNPHRSDREEDRQRIVRAENIRRNLPGAYCAPNSTRILF